MQGIKLGIMPRQIISLVTDSAARNSHDPWLCEESVLCITLKSNTHLSLDVVIFCEKTEF